MNYRSRGSRFIVLNMDDVIEFIIYTFLSFLLFSAIIGFMWTPNDMIGFMIDVVLAMLAVLTIWMVSYIWALRRVRQKREVRK